MPDPFKAVNPGDEIELTAIAWNAMLDAARQVGPRTGGNSGPIPGRQATIVQVSNGTGGDLARNSVVGLDGPIFTPEQSEDAFLREVTFRTITPDIDLHKRRFAILLDAIPADQVGRAYLDGVCQVKVDVVNESHRFARLIDMESGHLESCAHGYAELLWTEADGAYYGYDTGVMWAIVRLGTFGPHLFRGIVTTAISPGISSDGRATIQLVGGSKKDVTINNDYDASVAVGKAIVAYVDEDGNFWLLTADC